MHFVKKSQSLLCQFYSSLFSFVPIKRSPFSEIYWMCRTNYIGWHSVNLLLLFDAFDAPHHYNLMHNLSPKCDRFNDKTTKMLEKIMCKCEVVVRMVPFRKSANTPGGVPMVIGGGKGRLDVTLAISVVVKCICMALY